MSDQPHLLLVEDEPYLAKVIQESLEQRHYRVTQAGDGERGYQLWQTHLFSLCLIDVMLPQLDGFTLARLIRASNPGVPILFLTARTATQDVIAGYESGGNDYLKKPFSLDELFLRVHELLKRGSPPPLAHGWPIGLFVFDTQKQLLHFSPQPAVRLSHRETQLLAMLYEYKDTCLDRKQALLTLWGDDSFFHGRTMDVFITKLRKRLKQDPAVEILNLRGRGYKLIC